MKIQAIKTLEKNTMLNIDMLEPIKRGHADIIYADSETVLIKENNSLSYMLYSENVKNGEALLSKQPTKNIFAVCLHQEELLPIVKSKFGFQNQLACYQTANLNKKLVEIPKILDIKNLDPSYAQIVDDNYSSASLEEILELIEKKHIFGGFKNGELVGFMGIHEEGSCGLLEILPEHRKKGYATILEGFLNNYVINRGWIPFGQIVEDNHKSLNLQKKLGMDISKEKVYWVF